MATVKLYNQQGTVVGDLTLDASLFGVKPDAALVHEAAIAQKANSREAIAHTKDRGEVAGTGKKPWKQKGTGRARAGSRRSPIWVGGGITFGPTNARNFSLKMNRKARRKALAMVLSDKLASDRFVAIDSLKLPASKTKEMSNILKKLPMAGKKTIIIVEPGNTSAVRATRNLPRISTIAATSLNVVDLLAYDCVLASKEAIEVLTKTYKTA